MFNLRAKCPRSEWPLIKAKIHKITIILKNLLNLILLALIYELMLTSLSAYELELSISIFYLLYIYAI